MLNICGLSYKNVIVLSFKAIKKLCKNHQKNYQEQVTFSYLCRIKKNNFMIVDFDDENLEELIKTGSNSKYKKLSKDKNFIIALVSVYNVLLSVEKTDE